MSPCPGQPPGERGSWARAGARQSRGRGMRTGTFPGRSSSQAPCTGRAGLRACLSALSLPGVVPEPPDEGQEAALGYDLASPRRPGVLYLHDESRGGHGQPPLPLPVPPAPALLLPHGHRSHLGLCCRPVQHPAETAGHLPGPLPPLPQTRTAVRLQTPLPVPCPDPWTQQCGGRPLLMPGLSQQPVQRTGPETCRIRLYLLSHNQD